jgi:hypothetical protein
MAGGPLAELNAAYRALERALKGLEKAEPLKKAELEARAKGLQAKTQEILSVIHAW